MQGTMWSLGSSMFFLEFLPIWWVNLATRQVNTHEIANLSFTFSLRRLLASSITYKREQVIPLIEPWRVNMDILAIVAGAITLACKIASGLNSILIAPREVELVREEVRSSSSTVQAVQAHFNPQSTSYTPVQLQHLLRVTTGTKTTLNSLDELIDKIKTPRPFGRIRWTACIDEVSALRLSLRPIPLSWLS